MRNLNIALFCLTLLCTSLLSAQPNDPLHSPLDTLPAIKLNTVASGLNSPVFVASSESDSTRLYIVELGGKIKLMKNGVLQSLPFLDVSTLVCGDAENGLLGLCFDPNYKTNGFLYVKYNDHNCDVQLSRFTRSSNPDFAIAGSELKILKIVQPPSPDHNGGSMFFGPNDGFLYIPTADGQCCFDPAQAGQDPLTLKAKILRIDVHSGSPYAIPTTNPYFGHADTLPEIWAFGVRNPYRCSADRATGDLYIADVGQDSFEELNFQPANDTGKKNYGWSKMEGPDCFNGNPCDTTGKTKPLYYYPHDGVRCCIIGGAVYRGCAMPWLEGAYFFADLCSGQLWSLRHSGNSVTQIDDYSQQTNLGAGEIVGIGEDAQGEFYLCKIQQGTVLKMVPRDIPPASCSPSYVCGDANGDLTVNISDVVFLIQYIFAGGPAPNPLLAGDSNCDHVVNISDGVYLIQYIFASGPSPCAACK